MSAQKLLIANWKMWGNQEEWRNLATQVVSANLGRGVVIAPPMCALSFVGGVLKGSRLALAAQNVSKFADKGHTGEVSAVMLSNLGVRYVLIGHSERRLFEGETLEDTALKVALAIKEGLIPVLCVGESLEEKLSAQTLNILNAQLNAGLKNISISSGTEIVIAYEPVWGISNLASGAPKVQSKDIEIALQYIRKWLVSSYGQDVAQKVSILYGGSVDDKNASDYSTLDDLNGFLVGSAGLKDKIFVEIAHILGIK